MRHYKEHIYSLEERHESDISSLWQILQILFFTCCIVSGYTVCFTFGLALSTMQHNCILYSNFTFASNCTDSLGRLNNIKAVNSEFPLIYCELVLYIPLVLSTLGCFFAVMFAYCGRGGAGNPSMQETWRIIMPTVVYNLVSFCLTAYAANVFQSGLKHFLRKVAFPWGKAIVNLDEIGEMRLDDVYIGRDLIRFMSLTKHATWLNVSFWGLNFLWILLRLLFNVDFQLVRTTIHVYPRKQEIVQTISHASESETSMSIYSSSPNLSSVRLRTVQFSPSTNGPRPTAAAVERKEPSLEKLSSDADSGESQEIEISEINYNIK